MTKPITLIDATYMFEKGYSQAIEDVKELINKTFEFEHERGSNGCKICIIERELLKELSKLNSQQDKTIDSKNHADGKVHDSSRVNDGYKTADTFSNKLNNHKVIVKSLTKGGKSK